MLLTLRTTVGFGPPEIPTSWHHLVSTLSIGLYVTTTSLIWFEDARMLGISLAQYSTSR